MTLTAPADGRTRSAGAACTPVPAAFVAVTVNGYDTPSTSPVSTALVAPAGTVTLGAPVVAPTV